VAVIENYVKINEGIIIPLSSIVKIHAKESVISIGGNHERIGIIIFIVIAVMIIIAIIYLIAK
jgi:hypothetical protein